MDHAKKPETISGMKRSLVDYLSMANTLLRFGDKQFRHTNTTPIKETKYRKITSEILKLLHQKLKCENWKEVYREENPQSPTLHFIKY